MAGGIALYYITYLYNLGHFHNPKYPTGVTRADLVNLDLDDDVVKLAIKSYQEMMMPTLMEATIAAYGENVEAVVDGIIGAATAEVIATPRCGFPDHPLPEGAMGLQAGPQEANWPTACRTKLRFGRNFKALPGLNEAQTHQVWWASCNNWWTALKDFDMQPSVVGDKAGSHVYCVLGRLAGRILAQSYLAMNTCNAKLDQTFNTNVDWSNMLFASAVKTHEDGHALGFNHNNDGNALMYPSINPASQKRGGYPNATDLAEAKRQGYALSGLPAPDRAKLFLPRPWDTPPTGPTDPTDPTPVGVVTPDGTIQLVQDGKVLSEWFLAKKVTA